MAQIAVLLGPNFEDREFFVPVRELVREGHRVEVLGVDGHEMLVGKHQRRRVETTAAVKERKPES